MSIFHKIYLIIEIFTIILQGNIFFKKLLNTKCCFFKSDFICADISLSLQKNNFLTHNAEPFSKWKVVSNVTTQIGTHAYLECKVVLNSFFIHPSRLYQHSSRLFSSMCLILYLAALALLLLNYNKFNLTLFTFS